MGDATGRASCCTVTRLLWDRLGEKGTCQFGKQQVTGFLKEEPPVWGHIQSAAALHLGWRVARALPAWLGTCHGHREVHCEHGYQRCVPPALSGLQRTRGRYHSVDS